MKTKTKGHIHWSFWAITTIMLVWNIMGAMNFLWQINADSKALASLPETHQAIIIGRPLWATAGFAIGVFFGALGCLLLLLRKSSAYYLFLISLVGMIITMIHTIRIASSIIDFSFFEIFLMILMPMLVALFLIWYSKLTQNKGWAY